MRLLTGVMSYMMTTGCGLILDLDPRPEVFDAETDAHVRDAGTDGALTPDAGDDAGVSMDAFVPEDSGFDAAPDADLDAAADAAEDSGSPDAGPPRVLVFRHERPDRPDVAVRSVWISEDFAPWRSVSCLGGIRGGTGAWECTHDVRPLPVGQDLRFYFDYGRIGVSPSCGSTGCLGAHILMLDAVSVPDADITEEDAADTPAAPGSNNRVKAYLTPP